MSLRSFVRTRVVWILLSLAWLACPAAAREKSDILVMQNGDRITCQVKGLDAGVLKIDLDYVDGVVSVDWLKVARIESKFMFLIQLEDGSVYSGKVVNPAALEGTPVKMEIRTEDENTVAVDKDQVVRMTQTSDSFLQRVSGKLTLGASYTKGNNATQYNLGSELDYRQTLWGGRISFNSNLSSSTGATTATRNQVDMAAYRLLRARNYYVVGNVGYLQSSVQEIQRQTILGIGIGRFLKNTNRISLTLSGGFGWQRTNYTPTAETHRTQDIGVGLVTSTLHAFAFKKTRLDVTGTLVPALTEPGRLFAKMNASYYLKLFGKVDWNFSFYGNWDTAPPAHLPSSDYGSSTGFSYTFGNK